MCPPPPGFHKTKKEEVEVECANAIRKHRRKSLTYTRAANSIASALDETNYDSKPLTLPRLGGPTGPRLYTLLHISKTLCSFDLKFSDFS